MPISRVRYATAAYMVFIAPNIAPIDENQRDERAEHANHGRHHARLLGVVVVFAVRRQLEPRIGGDAPRRTIRTRDGSIELHGDRLIFVSLKRRHHQIDVAPHLGLERGIVVREDADDVPGGVAESDVAAERESGEALSGEPPDVDLARARRELAPLDET